MHPFISHSTGQCSRGYLLMLVQVVFEFWDRYPATFEYWKYNCLHGPLLVLLLILLPTASIKYSVFPLHLFSSGRQLLWDNIISINTVSACLLLLLYKNKFTSVVWWCEYWSVVKIRDSAEVAGKVATKVKFQATFSSSFTFRVSSRILNNNTISFVISCHFVSFVADTGTLTGTFPL